MDSLQFKYSTIIVKFNKEKCLVEVYLNRPEKLNAVNKSMLDDIKYFFSSVPQLLLTYDIRLIIIKGNGKAFCSGLDLNSEITQFISTINYDETTDVARKSIKIFNFIKHFQSVYDSITECPIPVISVVHNYCIGAGLGFVAACDMKIALCNSKYCIKEVDLGIAHDIGVIPRIAKLNGNITILKKLCFTGEIFDNSIASKLCLVDDVFEDELKLSNYLDSLIDKIASKSPIVISALKQNINYALEHSIQDCNNLIAGLNGSYLQSRDLSEAMMSSSSKRKAVFGKL
jgi:enoyl-CoA hydratase/carnithine racemase